MALVHSEGQHAFVLGNQGPRSAAQLKGSDQVCTVAEWHWQSK